jgi:hypothetical protein
VLIEQEDLEAGGAIFGPVVNLASLVYEEGLLAILSRLAGRTI